MNKILLTPFFAIMLIAGLVRGSIAGHDYHGYGMQMSEMSEYGFPGLKSDHRWCLCASRWKETLENGAAPPVVLSATNEAVLRYISLDDLIEHACEDSF